jgi:hypothetical protein
MRRLLIGLLILGCAIAAIAVISRRRSGSGRDEWDSFAAGDSYAQAPKAAAKATDAAKEVTAKARDAAKEVTAKARDAAKDA